MAHSNDKKRHTIENLVLWEKGQSGNPKGRPKLSFTIINDKLKEEGYTKLKKQDLIDAYSYIFNTDEARLKELVANKELPYFFRLIIMELNNTRTRSAALKDFRNYVFGESKTESQQEIVIRVEEERIS